MEKDEFKEKVKSGFDKFVLSTKKAFGKAGNTVQDFSDKSVTLIEKKQFESKRDAQYKKLGAYAAEIFLAGERAEVSKDEEAVAAIMAEIVKFNAEIKTREDSLAEAKKTSEARNASKKAEEEKKKSESDESTASESES